MHSQTEVQRGTRCALIRADPRMMPIDGLLRLAVRQKQSIYLFILVKLHPDLVLGGYSLTTLLKCALFNRKLYIC